MYIEYIQLIHRQCIYTCTFTLYVLFTERTLIRSLLHKLSEAQRIIIVIYI